MIGRVFEAGRSFREASLYVAKDPERAVVLAVEGVRGRDYRLMADDFELQHLLRPEVEKPVFHAVLSFPAGEDPGDERSVMLAREWMEEIGMAQTQAAFTKHLDTSHVHLHILANRVSNKGEIIGEGMVIQRGIRAARKLTRKYGLVAEENKNMDLINREALNPVDAKRHRLYEAIRDALPGCGQLEDLEERLRARGIAMRYKVDAGSGARVGVSFRIEDHAFKGSQVDPDFSIRGLEQRLREQRVVEKTQGLRQGVVEQRPGLVQEQRPGMIPRQRQRRGKRLGM